MDKRLKIILFMTAVLLALCAGSFIWLSVVQNRDSHNVILLPDGTLPDELTELDQDEYRKKVLARYDTWLRQTIGGTDLCTLDEYGMPDYIVVRSFESLALLKDYTENYAIFGRDFASDMTEKIEIVRDPESVDAPYILYLSLENARTVSYIIGEEDERTFIDHILKTASIG